MKLSAIFTGKTKEPYLQEGVEEYLKRIRRYISFDLVVIPDLKASRKMSTEEIRAIEGQQILQRMGPSDHLVLMDERGRQFGSVEFSRYIAGLEQRSGNGIFLIGGPYGFSEEIYTRSNEMISLSKMTFSHQMVRMFFLEQVYRAYTIIRGEPYHHR